jgi:AcrR family transcriptional regulator
VTRGRPGQAASAAVPSSATTRPPGGPAGRPRRFEPDDELRLLFEAAFVVMQRNGYADAAVADILAEAGLSTRSFYRHFQSKDQLLCALYRHEAEQVAGRLTARLSGAPSPLAALDGWIEEIMSLGYHRRKAARVAVLGSPGAMRAEGYADEGRHAMKLLIAPLRKLLADGLRDGTFPLADPESDAPLVQSVVWTAAGLSPLGEPTRSRDEAFSAVRSFCWRALGVPASDLLRGLRHPPVLVAQQPLE